MPIEFFQEHNAIMQGNFIQRGAITFRTVCFYESNLLSPETTDEVHIKVNHNEALLVY